MSKDEEIPKLRTEIKKLIEKSDLSDKKNEDLEQQLKMATKGDIEWTEFELRTKKKGAYGPSKNECHKYYSEKYAQNFS